jgi:hypothetical protein
MPVLMPVRFYYARVDAGAIGLPSDGGFCPQAATAYNAQI